MDSLMDKIARDIREEYGADLPVVLETSAGVRFTFDPETAPYAHSGVLVVPIVEDEGWQYPL